jgi:hypothetical protein
LWQTAEAAGPAEGKEARGWHLEWHRQVWDE